MNYTIVSVFFGNNIKNMSNDYGEKFNSNLKRVILDAYGDKYDLYSALDGYLSEYGSFKLKIQHRNTITESLQLLQHFNYEASSTVLMKNEEFKRNIFHCYFGYIIKEKGRTRSKCCIVENDVSMFIRDLNITLEDMVEQPFGSRNIYIKK